MRKLLNLALLCAIGVVAVALPAMAQGTPVNEPKSITAGPGMGGAGNCLSCHAKDDRVTPILQTPHAVRADPRSPFGQEGCTVCHGDSRMHMRKRGEPVTNVFKDETTPPANIKKSPAAQRTEVCLSCHENNLRMNWQGSAHQANNRACNDCHQIHVRKDPILVKFTQAEKCFTCHPRQRAESYMYSHHPLREGKVACSDCHNPHGSPGDTKLLKEFTVNETCYNCHPEKRGPMLWEHQPVRDNCLNCHTPHGSNEPRLWKTRLQFLCVGCHSGSGNAMGGAVGGGHSIPYRKPGNPNFVSFLGNQRFCLNCHSQIHGSNSPSGAYFFR